jgi:hypothetical protein
MSTPGAARSTMPLRLEKQVMSPSWPAAPLQEPAGKSRSYWAATVTARLMQAGAPTPLAWPSLPEDTATSTPQRLPQVPEGGGVRVPLQGPVNSSSVPLRHVGGGDL